MTDRVVNNEKGLSWTIEGEDFRKEREEVSERFCDSPDFCSKVLLALFEEEASHIHDPEQVLFLARDYELLLPIGYTSSNRDIIGLLEAIGHVRHLLKMHGTSGADSEQFEEVKEHIDTLTLNHQSLYSLALNRIFEIVQESPGDAVGLERYLSSIEDKFMES
jgi:hypothetical protein